MRTVLAICLLFAAGPAAAQPAPFDPVTEFKKIWANSLIQIELGRWAIVRPGFETKVRMNESTFKIAQAGQFAGLVTIKDDPQFEQFKQGTTFNWNNMLNMTTEGVTRLVDISSTPLGKSLQTCACDSLQIRTTVRVDVQKVLTNEPIRKGADDYRLVKLTYAKIDSEAWQKMLIFLNGRSDEIDHKAIVLFKFDPFKSQWVLDQMDLAEASREFISKTVDEKLRQ